MYTEVLAPHFKNPFLKPAVSFRSGNREDYNKDDYGVSRKDNNDSSRAVRRRFESVLEALEEKESPPKKVEKWNEDVKKIQKALDLLV